MFKLAFCLFLAISAAAACQQAGTTVTTKTTTETVTTVSGSGSGSVAGLADSDRALIASSWERMRKNGKIAPQILLRFVKAHPELQKKFTAFANVPQSDLLTNGDFLAQAFTIMAGLNVIVRSLAVPELLQAEASHLGKTHFVRGVSVAQFEQFARAALDAIREDAQASDAEVSAWENGLTALIAKIGKSLKAAEDVPSTLTGLTPNQVNAVQRTWANLRGDRDAIVSSIFLKLFPEDASLQAKFSFAGVALGDLPNNAAYKAQVSLVANRLDSIISHLNTPLKLGGEMRYMAFSHKSRAVLRQEFEAFGKSLLNKLAAKGVTDGDLEAWKGVLSVLLGKIAKVQGL